MTPMTAFRFGLPGLIALAGLVLLVVGGEVATGIGIVFIGSAFLIFLFNLFIRLGGSSQDDRDREQAAREEFTRTGRWPDPPPGREEGP